jgi:hypothetical protein
LILNLGKRKRKRAGGVVDALTGLRSRIRIRVNPDSFEVQDPAAGVKISLCKKGKIKNHKVCLSALLHFFLMTKQ